MKHVTQKNEFDYSICCLAMMLGQSYYEILNFFGGEIVDGLINSEIIDCAANFGVKLKLTKAVPIGRAIIVVPSLKNSERTHAVYYDGKSVHDPTESVDRYIWRTAKKAMKFALEERELNEEDELTLRRSEEI